MPWIIDYQTVIDRMRQQGLKCLYYNSGAFGFTGREEVQTIGWIGPQDSTIREAMREHVRLVPAPYESNLAALAQRFWQDHLPGPAWVMPMSHWAYELDYGSRDWMPALLEKIDIDPGLLVVRNNAAAIEFSGEESGPFAHFVERLLEMLQTSDFMIAFPRRNILCSVHHHKQLWWTTTQAHLAEALRTAPMPH